MDISFKPKLIPAPDLMIFKRDKNAEDDVSLKCYLTKEIYIYIQLSLTIPRNGGGGGGRQKKAQIGISPHTPFESSAITLG